MYGAPKKKVVRKRRKKKVGDEKPPALIIEEENEHLIRRLETLRFQQMQATTKSADARNVVYELRTGINGLQSDLKNEKKRTFEIAADMTRQYKAMRQELVKKISGLQDDIAEYKDRLELAKLDTEEVQRRKSQIITLKDSEINEQKNKMDEMAHEFGQMLKVTLDKMSEKIVITNDWEEQQQQHMQGGEGGSGMQKSVSLDETG